MAVLHRQSLTFPSKLREVERVPTTGCSLANCPHLPPPPPPTNTQPRCAQVWLALLRHADDLLLISESEERSWKVCRADMIDSFQLPLAFFQTTFAVNHGQPVIYWHRWHFSVCTLPPLRRRPRRLPVHPSHLLILSINASRQAGRQAPGYRPHPPHPPPSSALALQHPHPSIPLHHSQLKGAAWVPLICSL